MLLGNNDTCELQFLFLSQTEHRDWGTATLVWTKIKICLLLYCKIKHRLSKIHPEGESQCRNKSCDCFCLHACRTSHLCCRVESTAWVTAPWFPENVDGLTQFFRHFLFGNNLCKLSASFHLDPKLCVFKSLKDTYVFAFG